MAQMEIKIAITPEMKAKAFAKVIYEMLGGETKTGRLVEMGVLSVEEACGEMSRKIESIKTSQTINCKCPNCTKIIDVVYSVQYKDWQLARRSCWNCGVAYQKLFGDDPITGGWRETKKMLFRKLLGEDWSLSVKASSPTPGVVMLEGPVVGITRVRVDGKDIPRDQRFGPSERVGKTIDEMRAELGLPPVNSQKNLVVYEPPSYDLKDTHCTLTPEQAASCEQGNSEKKEPTRIWNFPFVGGGKGGIARARVHASSITVRPLPDDGFTILAGYALGDLNSPVHGVSSRPESLIPGMVLFATPFRKRPRLVIMLKDPSHTIEIGSLSPNWFSFRLLKRTGGVLGSSSLKQVAGEVQWWAVEE